MPRQSAILIFALAASVISGAAQGISLSGTVLDITHSLVPGATVIVVETGHKAVTDGEGKFLFSNFEPGRYTLLVMADYFEDIEKTITVSAPATDVVVEFSQLRVSRTQVDVIGAEDEVLTEVPGSAAVVTAEQLLSRHSTHTAEVLRQVPGLHVVEDSGPFSMRLNLGVRGLNPDRSRQLLVLEDGVPLALAPYGEPEMYYSPPIDRMHRVEILKGSGSILFGPQTVGGVVNFITPDPPRKEQKNLYIVGGTNQYFVGQTSWGNTFGRTGLLINYLRKQGDGFRRFRFDINDLTAKIRVELTQNQYLGFKFNVYDEGSNSTYLGLTLPQYLADRNYNSVAGDLLELNRHFGSANHQIVIGSHLVLNTTLFAYHTVRNWRRQEYERRPVPGRSYLRVDGDPTVPGGAVYLRDAAGHRNREFNVFGIESRAAAEHTLLGIASRLEFGARYLYEQAHEKFISSSAATANTGILRDNEFRTGRAGSFFVQNRFHLTDRITLTPGVRLEKFNYQRHVLRKRVNGVPTDVDVRALDKLSEVIPGIGLTFQPTQPLTLFTGVHQGFAPPRVKDALNSDGGTLQLDAEQSTNFELGARYTKKDYFRAEATFFSLDFANQVIPASQSAGQSSFGLLNAGETLHRGVEIAVGFDIAPLRNLTASMPLEVQYTYLPTVEFTSGFQPAISGNRLPYAPKHLLGGSLAYRRPRGLGIQLDFSYIGSQYSDPFNIVDATTGIPALGVAPNFDGQTGLIPAYTLVNLSAEYALKRTDEMSVAPFVSVRNLTDRNYIASRAPEGIQPGWPRQFTAGLRFRF